MAQSRYYRYVTPRRQTDTGADVQRGLQAGQQIGKLLGGLGSSLSSAIQSARQNKVANQLLAQNYPDRPGGTDPDPDPVDAQGNLTTDPSTPIPDVQLPAIQGNFQGGIDELKLRQQFEKENLANQIERARLENTGPYAKRAQAVAPGVTATGGGSSSRWLSGGGENGGNQGGGQGGQGGRGGKPTPYQPGSGDVQNDESTDDSSQIAADFDNTYSQKGLYGKYLANIGSLKPDDQGNYPLTNSKGEVIASVPGSDAAIWQQRTNAARLKRGLTPIGPLGDGQNPTSNAPVGSQTNPIIIQSKLHVRSIPFGKWVYDPNTGQTYQKQQPPSQ